MLLDLADQGRRAGPSALYLDDSLAAKRELSGRRDLHRQLRCSILYVADQLAELDDADRGTVLEGAAGGVRGGRSAGVLGHTVNLQLRRALVLDRLAVLKPAVRDGGGVAI